MRLGPGLLYEGRTLQGARPKLADFCSATMAEFYSAVDKLKLKRWNFILALHQRVKIPELHSPAALVRFTLNLSRLRW